MKRSEIPNFETKLKNFEREGQHIYAKICIYTKNQEIYEDIIKKSKKIANEYVIYNITRNTIFQDAFIASFAFEIKGKIIMVAITEEMSSIIRFDLYLTRDNAIDQIQLFLKNIILDKLKVKMNIINIECKEIFGDRELKDVFFVRYKRLQILIYFVFLILLIILVCLINIYFKDLSKSILIVVVPIILTTLYNLVNDKLCEKGKIISWKNYK